MDPIYLNNEQIDYELEIRGLPHPETEHHRTKSGRLRECLVKEHAGVLEAPGRGTSPYTPTNDLGICQSACAKISDAISKEDLDRGELETLLSQSYHTADRLRRIDTAESLQVEARQLFVATAQELIQVIRERITLLPPSRARRPPQPPAGMPDQAQAQQSFRSQHPTPVSQPVQTGQTSAPNPQQPTLVSSANESRHSQTLEGAVGNPIMTSIAPSIAAVQTAPSNITQNPFDADNFFALRRSTAYWDPNFTAPAHHPFGPHDELWPNTNEPRQMANNNPLRSARNDFEPINNNLPPTQRTDA